MIESIKLFCPQLSIAGLIAPLKNSLIYALGVAILILGACYALRGWANKPNVTVENKISPRVFDFSDLQLRDGKMLKVADYSEKELLQVRKVFFAHSMKNIPKNEKKIFKSCNDSLTGIEDTHSINLEDRIVFQGSVGLTKRTFFKSITLEKGKYQQLMDRKKSDPSLHAAMEYLLAFARVSILLTEAP